MTPAQKPSMVPHSLQHKIRISSSSTGYPSQFSPRVAFHLYPFHSLLSDFSINITYQYPMERKVASLPLNPTFKCSSPFLVKEILTYLYKLDKLHKLPSETKNCFRVRSCDVENILRCSTLRKELTLEQKGS